MAYIEQDLKLNISRQPKQAAYMKVNPRVYSYEWCVKSYGWS
jgi:hypothetical protein